MNTLAKTPLPAHGMLEAFTHTSELSCSESGGGYFCGADDDDDSDSDSDDDDDDDLDDSRVDAALKFGPRSGSVK